MLFSLWEYSDTLMLGLRICEYFLDLVYLMLLALQRFIKTSLKSINPVPLRAYVYARLLFVLRWLMPTFCLQHLPRGWWGVPYGLQSAAVSGLCSELFRILWGGKKQYGGKDAEAWYGRILFKISFGSCCWQTTKHCSIVELWRVFFSFIWTLCTLWCQVLCKTLFDKRTTNIFCHFTKSSKGLFVVFIVICLVSISENL